MAEPASSPLAAALDSVGDRWTLLLVEALLDGPRRFGDLQERCRASRRTCSPSACAGSRARGWWSPSPTASARSATCTSSPRRATSWPARCACWPTGARATRESGEPPRHDVVRHPGRGALVVPHLRAPGGRRRRGRPALRIVRQSLVATDTFSPRGGSAHTGPRGRPTAVRAARFRRRAAAWAGRPPGREPEEVYRRRRLIAAGDRRHRLPAPDRPDRERRRRRLRAREHAVRPRRAAARAPSAPRTGTGPTRPHDRDRHHRHARGARHAARAAAPAAAPATPARPAPRETAEAWARRPPLRRPRRRRARAAAPRRPSPRAPGAAAAA